MPTVKWDDIRPFQQRLVYEIGEPPRRRGALLLCEHEPILTVGRQGSRAHLRAEDDDPTPVKWVNRGGGVWFQSPGQLAAYCILPLEPPRRGVDWLRDRMYETVTSILQEFQITAQRDSSHGGVMVGDRQIASVGLAIKDEVSYFGAVLNVSLPPNRDRVYQPHPLLPNIMETCMLRERMLPVRPGTIREAFARHFAKTFEFGTYFVCHAPPLVSQPVRRHAIAR